MQDTDYMEIYMNQQILPVSGFLHGIMPEQEISMARRQ